MRSRDEVSFAGQSEPVGLGKRRFAMPVLLALPFLLHSPAMAWQVQQDAQAAFDQKDARERDELRARQEAYRQSGYSLAVCELAGSFLTLNNEKLDLQRFGRQVKDVARKERGRHDPTGVNTWHRTQFANGTRVYWVHATWPPDGQSDQVNRVEINATTLDAGGGLRVGDPKAKAFEVFGPTSNASRTRLQWGCDAVTLTVDLRRGRVAKVTWSSDAD